MADESRRRMLRRLDELLERVEQLRVHDVAHVPDRLSADVARVAADLDQRGPQRPGSIAGTHDYLFRLQSLLLRGGGGYQNRPPSAARPVGQLPPLKPSGSNAVDASRWQERTLLILERARDRVRYLEAQAAAAGRLDPLPQLPGPRSATRNGYGSELAAERAAQATAARRDFERLSADVQRMMDVVPELPAAPVLPVSGRLLTADIVIDLDAGTVFQRGQLVRLTAVERTILAILLANQGRIVTREAMLLLAYGDDPRIDLTSNALRVHLSRIRAKLGDPPYLEAVPEVGYVVSMPAGERLAGTDDLEHLRQRRREQRRAWARTAPASPGSNRPESSGQAARRQRQPGR